ncbi:O-antigen ligase RfaL [Dryocola clanedunensis]|uniref:O-antigen ligase RfaL n=1 Tax=Cedecea sulfonylureivorans TaxID=3051154 RepID=UPI001928E2F1|nr:O-antigen ligase RfaL [Cedecea sulfonylureivorans]
MIAALLSKEDQNWQPLWNKALVFLFITTFFLDGITRYKHIVEILMIVTSLYYIFRSPKICLSLLKNNLFYSILALSAVLLYSIFISPDMKVSFKEFNNTVIKGILLYSLLLPLLLKNETKETVSKLILISFLSSLSVKCAVELVLYYQDYKQGIMPFTNYNHRHISDSMVFLFPALLNLWLFKKTSLKVAFAVCGCIYLFLMLGTLSRGAWLAIFITAVLWLIFNRFWKLLVASVIIFIAAGTLVMSQHGAKSDKLIYKLQQTDSSYRYTNGTQGSAMSLILENPIKGYGYGDDIYHNLYNKRIIDYPTWTFKKSIGPHNLALYIWFGAGILGLGALLYVYGSVINEIAGKAFISTATSPYNVHLLLFLSLVGFFLVRGNFEQIELAPLGIITGLLLALRK